MGRYTRHSALNDIIKRALDAAGMDSVLETEVLDRGDDRRPDDITVFSFLQGKSLIWAATCTDTFAPSLITTSSALPAAAAEDSKRGEHTLLESGFYSYPFSVETSGVIGSSAIALIKEVGRRIADREDDSRSTSILFLKISLAIVLGNIFSILRSGKRCEFS